ncbi:hypothetical protein WAI453_009255 [Rhynchosporium graminicola]|uniref:Uncharacterized protein n=1 Tax=Rhynchosporium graminicola TaxID=2792576 RepID=A0A1E1KRF2_9HELO|nr:uncharacterized protein RCO7_03022 [Rhynchosporium commune]
MGQRPGRRIVQENSFSIDSSPAVASEGFRKLKMTCKLALAKRQLYYGISRHLLCPSSAICFYDAAWKYPGEKQTLKIEISANSQISLDILAGAKSLEEIPTAVRMQEA